MSTDREKIDAQARIHLSAKHAIGPVELEILFKQRDELAALSQTAPSAQEGVREAVTKALDFMVNNGSYTMTLEGRIALKEAHLIEQFGTASKQALSATPSASALGEWRPIETAPKDGTRVLGCDADGVRDRFWWAEGAGWLRLGGRLYTPVAWMPLPAALADTDGKKGE